MSAVPKSRLTPAEYLAKERAADFKSEYFRGETFAMAGASFAHNLVKDNLSWCLRNALAGSNCTTVTSDTRVKVSATGLYTYPDVILMCGPPELEDRHGDTLLNPHVIFEVLSDSTEKYDRGKKFDHYRSIPSLREYVLVAQDAILIERYVRQPDETWVLTIFRDPAGDFALATATARVRLTDVYQGVAFTAPESIEPGGT